MIAGAAPARRAATGPARQDRQNMKTSELADVLVSLGCPPEKSAAMAAQLDKRAKQLAEEKQRSYEEALAHLLNLMRQGWAAPKDL
jgi:hypothetical protein